MLQLSAGREPTAAREMVMREYFVSVSSINWSSWAVHPKHSAAPIPEAFRRVTDNSCLPDLSAKGRASSVCQSGRVGSFCPGDGTLQDKRLQL